MNEPVADNWYENFFSGINCSLWEQVATPAWTDDEVNFLTDVLNVKPGDHLLDIPCGVGRHSVAFAKRGFQLTSVDISDEYVAKLGARVKKEKLPIQIIHGNILSVTISGSFDGAYCMGNSFGYFNIDSMRTFVKKVADGLRPGARFVINSGMVAESILPHPPGLVNFTFGDTTMEIDNTYVAAEGYLISRILYNKETKPEKHSFKHYIFTLSEIIRLLASANLKTVAVYNSTQKLPYEPGDRQMFLVAEKK
jgi:cyclopropane fatty-acyl-phospholipid synthase-like methyltransferase